MNGSDSIHIKIIFHTAESGDQKQLPNHLSEHYKSTHTFLARLYWSSTQLAPKSVQEFSSVRSCWQHVMQQSKICHSVAASSQTTIDSPSATLNHPNNNSSFQCTNSLHIGSHRSWIVQSSSTTHVLTPAQTPFPLLPLDNFSIFLLWHNTWFNINAHDDLSKRKKNQLPIKEFCQYSVKF